MERRELSSAAGGAVSSRGPAAGLLWVVGTFCGCSVLPWGGGQVGEEASEGEWSWVGLGRRRADAVELGPASS